MGDISDNELMMRLANGETEHLACLYRRWRPKVAALCYGVTGSSIDVDDLVHDVFLRVVRYAHTFRDGGEFGSWLYTMVRRVCFDHLRRIQRAGLVLALVQRDIDSAGQPHDNEHIARLRRAFEGLQPEQREILVLHRIHGWKYRELAEAWNLTEGAVKLRSHRALTKLRERFRQLEREENGT